MLEITVQENIDKFTDIYNRKMLAFSLSLQNDMRNEVIRNIGKTFGKRRAGSTGYKSGRSGNLKNSVQMMSLRDYGWKLTVGNGQVPYAAIHEYGGVITPKKAKWLTIPLEDEAVGHSAREFDLVFISDAEYPGRRAYLVDVNSGWKFLYLLVKRVTMPKRPYVQPAIDKVFSQANIYAMLEKIWSK